MEPPKRNFFDTVSNGIQDIAAILPLLGTDQCERHVGEALQNGYLYAAATPLSIFGSLGVVKVSFATLLATTTKLFDGGSWLHDAGFSTTGLVASMITLQRGTKRYGAEAHLERLMKEKHIGDPEIIKHIHWSGWKRAGDVGTVGTERLRLYLPWNAYLILTSAVASGLALLPYIYFAIYNQGNNHVWLFPSLRSSGSFLCVVSVQLVLQFRIHYIASSSLHLMKAKGGVKPLSDREKGMLLEERIEELEREEQQQQHPKDVEAQHPIDSAPLFPVDPVLGILQFSLVLGMVMIVAGYVGCFNLVSQTRAKGGPYVWLAVEAALSVGRTVVWGLNPRWDEENTGLMFELGLRPRQSSISSAAGTSISLKWGLQVDSDAGSAMTSTAAAQTFPPITSPRYHLLDEETPIQYAGQDAQWKHSFVAHNLEDFLVAASPYIGPLERIEVDGFSIYYAVVAKASQNHIRKLLCVTIVSRGAAWDAHSFLVDGQANDSCRCAFSSHTRPLPGTHALEVAFYGKLDDIGPNTGLDNEVLSPVIEYSNKLSCLLVAKGSNSRPLSVLWSLTFPPTSSNAAEVKKVELRSEIEAGPLSEISLSDKIYMRIGQLCDLKGDRCVDRGDLLGELTFAKVPPAGLLHDLFIEYAVIFDSAIQEVYLCVMEQRFVEHAAFPKKLSHCLALQWIQKMEARLSAEQGRAILRLRGRIPLSTIDQISATWSSLSSELRSLRLRPAGDKMLQTWKDIFDLIHSGKFPSVKHLFEHQPFTSPHVRRDLDTNLLPFFTDESPQDYHELVSFVKSSLDCLHSMKQPGWFRRIDPRGPGSPEFSPPYTFIDSPRNAEALGTDIMLRKFLALRGTDSACDFLLSVPTSPTPLALTTIIHCNLQSTGDTASRLRLLLEKHRNITSVFYDRCVDFAGQAAAQEVQSALASNRQKWRENASNKLCHQIGLDDTPNSGKEDFEGILSVQPVGRDLMLQHRVCVTAMIHIPVPGKIVPILSVKTLSEPNLNFWVTLTFIGTDSYERDHNDPIRRNRQVESLKWCKLSFDDFPQVLPGHYEMYVTPYNQSAYLFRNLVVEFIPTTGGVLRLHRGVFRDHSKVTPRLGARKEGEEQDDTADAMDSQSQPDVVVAESAAERNAVLPHHQNLLETISVPRPGGSAPKALKESPLPVYRFEIFLRGPEDIHHGSLTFSPEGHHPLHLSELDSLTMALSLCTKKLRLDRYWSAANPCPEPSGVEECVTRYGPQEEVYAAWSKITGFVESSGPEDLEGQPQGPEEEAETTDRPIQRQNLFGVHYAFDDSGPGHTGKVETHGSLVREFISPPVYQSQFSFHGPEICHHGTFTLRGKTRDSQLVNLTIVLFPFAKELELQQHWFNPNSDRDASFKVTDDMAQADPAVSDKIFGKVDPQASGMQEANPREEEGTPDATGISLRQQDEDNNRTLLVPPPNESEYDHRETKCSCRGRQELIMDQIPQPCTMVRYHRLGGLNLSCD
ncbi:hypothetical protein PM082_011580 [Marasmius tenuissimus]|nr:hypothetical protein PM082_011580 [Marasmius tenuissimus]